MNKIVAVALAIILIAVVAAFLLLGNKGSEDENTLKQGDYLKYDWRSTMMNATMYINVTAVNETGYEITTTLIHEDGYVETPDSFFVETGTGLWWSEDPDMGGLTESLVGTETISTELGSRTVNHYHNVTETGTVDIYLGTENQIWYKGVMDQGSFVMNIDLVETNIVWV